MDVSYIPPTCLQKPLLDYKVRNSVRNLLGLSVSDQVESKARVVLMRWRVVDAYCFD
jgi:hypothetical protein